MQRGQLKITNKGEVTVFNNVVRFTVKANMIEVVCMKKEEKVSDQKTTQHGVKGWDSYDYN